MNLPLPHSASYYLLSPTPKSQKPSAKVHPPISKGTPYLQRSQLSL